MTAVAHELAANAVVHGAGHGRLRLWADGGFLYCQVSDDGRRRARTRERRGRRRRRCRGPPSTATDCGWSGQVADDVGIGHGPAGTTATARFPLAPG